MAKKKAEQTVKKANEVMQTNSSYTKSLQGTLNSAEQYYESSAGILEDRLREDIFKAHIFINDVIAPSIENASSIGQYSIAVMIDPDIADLVVNELREVYFYNVSLVSSLNSVYSIGWEKVIAYEMSQQGDYEDHPVVVMVDSSYKLIYNDIEDEVTQSTAGNSFTFYLLEGYPCISPSNKYITCVIRRDGADPYICTPSEIRNTRDTIVINHPVEDRDDIYLTYPIYNIPMWSVPKWMSTDATEGQTYFNKLEYDKGKVTVLYG